MARVLFISKTGNGSAGYWRPFSGMANSIGYVVELLREQGHDAEAVTVADNNVIDREVTAYQPTHCVIEALWVVPEKFPILRSLHPTVRWCVRLHSELPFLQMEGVATEWLWGYAAQGLTIAPNSRRTVEDLRRLLSIRYPHRADRIVAWLPNAYPFRELDRPPPAPRPEDGELHLGVFGAVRPLKNLLIQAAAAVVFADEIRRVCVLHVNADRVEQNGDPVLKNVRGLFAGLAPHRLEEHAWADRDAFMALLARLDVVTQVSLTESFNLVCADAVATGVPVVASPEVRWLPSWCQADPTDRAQMVAKLRHVWAGRPDGLHLINRDYLRAYVQRAGEAWWS